VSNLTDQILQPIVDAFQVPLVLALCLAVFIAVSRTASYLWYFTEHRGRHPLVIRTGGGTEAQRNDAGNTSLNERLLAYLAADGQDGYVIAPGAGGPAAPGVTAEALEPRQGWGAALLRLAVAREPSYIVDVSWPHGPEAAGQRVAVVRISRAPGDRVVASGSFTESGEDTIIGIIGCFCITFLRRQPRLLRHTPRWERWSQDLNGYRAYRDGLDHQRRGITTRSPEEYEIALRYFDKAARIEPANLLVQLHRAALLELTDRYDEAADIYTMCHALWPEHIEMGYRLGNARKNAPDHVAHHEVLKHLRNLKTQLAVPNLVRYWLRTYIPSRWNPGERHYWRSWLQLSLPGRVTKRATYRHAIAIAELLAELSWMLTDRPGYPCSGKADQLIERLGAQLLPKAKVAAMARLLHPEHREAKIPEHDHAWHDGGADDGSQIATYRSGEHRRDIGWLALFNAACFFSLAIELKPHQIPDSFQPSDWAQDCARAAIRELGILVRQPRHELEPDWLAKDPDLAALRRSPAGRAWASFVGLTTPVEEALPIQAPVSSITGKSHPNHLDESSNVLNESSTVLGGAIDHLPPAQSSDHQHTP
jgi:tetratricopeptide (TPR) repeat protein